MKLTVKNEEFQVLFFFDLFYFSVLTSLNDCLYSGVIRGNEDSRRIETRSKVVQNRDQQSAVTVGLHKIMKWYKFVLTGFHNHLYLNVSLRNFKLKREAVQSIQQSVFDSFHVTFHKMNEHTIFTKLMTIFYQVCNERTVHRSTSALANPAE